MRLLVVLALVSLNAWAEDIGDLLGSPPQTVVDTIHGLYPTKQAFIAATLSGDIPQQLLRFPQTRMGISDEERMLWHSVVSVLQNDYDLPRISYSGGRPNRGCLEVINGSAITQMRALVSYQINRGDEFAQTQIRSEWDYIARWCNMNEAHDGDFISGYKHFLQDFSDALPAFVASKQKERQEAEQKATEEVAAMKAAHQRQLAERRQASNAAKAARLAEVERAKEQTASRKALESTPSYKVLQAEKQIRAAKLMQAYAQDAIDKENKIGSISGYVNTGLLHEAGAAIVQAQESIDRYWTIYKANGGIASSIEYLIRAPASETQ